MVRLQGAAQVGAAQTAAGMTAMVEPTTVAGDSVQGIADKLTAAQEASKAFAESVMESSVSVQDSYALQLEQLILLKEQELITEEEFGQMKIDMIAERQAQEKQMLADGLANKKIFGQEAAVFEMDLAKRHALELDKVDEERKKKKKKRDEEEINMVGDFFGNIASLSSTGNKTLGGIAKAAAIGQATISTYVAANKAAEWGYPLGPIFAAGAVIAGLANVAKIASTPLATGIDSVPGVGTADNFPAMLAPGERVVPSKTNEDLTNFLAKQQSGGQGITVNVVMNDVFTSDPREMGLKIINVINETASSNGIKILGSSVT